jgi:hypothetical protein
MHQLRVFSPTTMLPMSAVAANLPAPIRRLEPGSGATQADRIGALCHVNKAFLFDRLPSVVAWLRSPARRVCFS